MSRQEEIVKWLSTSDLAIPYKNGKGFFILKGPKVRLLNGLVMEVLEWLFREGITDGLTINSYKVVYTKPGGQYHEKLCFYEAQEVYGAYMLYGNEELDGLASDWGFDSWENFLDSNDRD